MPVLRPRRQVCDIIIGLDPDYMQFHFFTGRLEPLMVHQLRVIMGSCGPFSQRYLGASVVAVYDYPTAP